jgi:hypothetical protein
MIKYRMLTKSNTADRYAPAVLFVLQEREL